MRNQEKFTYEMDQTNLSNIDYIQRENLLKYQQ